MATAQQHNTNNYDDDNDTNDCPICLCPLSTPWGICTPCGHAYCRGCWDQLAAASYSSGNIRGNNKPSCAVYPTSNEEENNDEEDDDDEEENTSLMNIWDHGQREVAAICANFIDLTQDDKHDTGDDDDDVPLRKVSRKQQQKEKATPPPSPQEREALQQKEQRTYNILRRLKQLHSEMIQFQLDNITRQSSSSSSFSNITMQQTQKLRSKLIKLQSSNANLTFQLQSHQSEIDTLNARMESYQKALTERTVETEKEKRRAENITLEFKLMEQSYEKHVSKSAMEQKALKMDIRRLQDQVTKLTSQSGLQDLQEMEEIRRKYSKMSQDVHLLRSENARLTKRLEDERAVWTRGFGREKAKCKQMLTEMVNMQSDKGEEELDVSDGGKYSLVAQFSSHHNKSIKSRKVGLDGRGRDQPMIPPKMISLVAAAATTTSSSFNLKAVFPTPQCKDNPPNKSKAMNILDNTRSRKHSLQQNNLLMSVKRTKATSFAKEKAPTRSNNSTEVATYASSSGTVHHFFQKKKK
ncbi:hypothetical protein ACHAXM_009764 [Skeletonema potamos]